jgi:hypothetical protein
MYLQAKLQRNTSLLYGANGAAEASIAAAADSARYTGAFGTCMLAPGSVPYSFPPAAKQKRATMSGMRDFVTGSDLCTPSDGAGPSNAVGALVNQLLGGASKTQEQLRDVSAVARIADAAAT